MTDEDILGAMEKCTKDGFSLGNIIRRTRFYSKKIGAVDHELNATQKDWFQKVTFVFVWQTKIKKGIIGLANTGTAG